MEAKQTYSAKQLVKSPEDMKRILKSLKHYMKHLGFEKKLGNELSNNIVRVHLTVSVVQNQNLEKVNIVDETFEETFLKSYLGR